MVEKKEYTIPTRNIVIATGGYASDKTSKSLIKQFRPEIYKFATTNGPFATGDGHRIAMKHNAAVVNMKDIQVIFVSLN